MAFSDANNVYRGETHMWRVPRGASILDQFLLVVLTLVAFSLPLEGMLDNYLPGRVRSLPYYLMILGAGLAFLRLPYVFKQFLKNRGLPLIALVYVYITIVYMLNPMVDYAPTMLLIQLLILAATYTYVADDPRIRTQLQWSYFLGWCILVLLSVYEFQRGNFNLYERGDIIRAKDILGFTANQHARQIGTGLIMSFVLLTEDKTKGILKLFVMGNALFGSVALLMGNSRSTLLVIIFILIVIVAYQMFKPAIHRLEPVSTDKVARVFFISIALFAVYLVYTETSLGRTLFESNLNRLEDIQEGDVGTRDLLWSGSFQVALDHPFGVGSNNSPLLLAQEIDTTKDTIDAHNYYLRILMEGGFLGLAIFLLGIWFVLHRGWQWVMQSGETTYFFCFMFILLVSLSGINFHLKITWFFLAMNAIIPTIASPKTEANANIKYSR